MILSFHDGRHVRLAGFFMEFVKHFVWENFGQPAMNPHGGRRRNLKVEKAYEGLELQE